MAKIVIYSRHSSVNKVYMTDLWQGKVLETSFKLARSGTVVYVSHIFEKLPARIPESCIDLLSNVRKIVEQIVIINHVVTFKLIYNKET